MEQKLYNSAAKLPETDMEFAKILEASGCTKIHTVKKWRSVISVAVGLIILLSVAFGVYAYAAEIKEYNAAVQFFDDYNLSTDGLSRSEIKAVYRDITTNSFTYSKTADVIERSMTTDQVEGYEIIQENPTPEDVENLWNYKNSTVSNIDNSQSGSGIVRYAYRSEYKHDDSLGFEFHDRSFIEKYEGDTLVWSFDVTKFWITGYRVVSDGVIAYGETPTFSSDLFDYAWMVKLDSNGKQQWMHRLSNGLFSDEYIADILENDDGSYAVISRGDFKYFCLSQYSSAGVLKCFKKTYIGEYGIKNVAHFGDGYIVQLSDYMTNEHAKIVTVDYSGNITDSFSYDSADSYYYITDMIEFEGNIYLSAYAVPKLEDEENNAGGRYEIAGILNRLHGDGRIGVTSETLTSLVRENYTAILLICNPDGGMPQEFYSVKGSLGGQLSISDTGMLSWNVESISSTYYSPQTSSFSIGGTCHVYQYYFDGTGKLVSQEKTKATTIYRR